MSSSARPEFKELGILKLATPCGRQWSELRGGGERVRFCGDCSLHVYNLSSLTADQAREFLMRQEGRLCVRFFRRPDGTVLTRDCPVGLTRLRRGRVFGWAAIALMGLVGLLPLGSLLRRACFSPTDALGGLDEVSPREALTQQRSPSEAVTRQQSLRPRHRLPAFEVK